MLPDFSLPPEKSLLSNSKIMPPEIIKSQTKINFEQNKRKFRILKDIQTVIDKKSFKAQLEDVSSILRPIPTTNQRPVKENRIDTIQLISTPACGLISEKLCKVYKSIVFDNKFDDLKFLEGIDDKQAEKTTIEEPIFNEPMFEGGFDSSIHQTRNRPILNDIPKDLNSTFVEISEFFVSRECSTFCEFTAHSSRESACKKFVALLHLFKIDALNMDQTKPFQDITIYGSNLTSTLFQTNIQ